MTSSTRSTLLCHILTVIDGESEELLDLLEFKDFDLEAFAVQFDVPIEHDPQMLEKYAVGPDDAAFVCSALGREITFDFTQYGYFIEAAHKDT
jgi:hypothetical protein